MMRTGWSPASAPGDNVSDMNQTTETPETVENGRLSEFNIASTSSAVNADCRYA